MDRVFGTKGNMSGSRSKGITLSFFRGLRYFRTIIVIYLDHRGIAPDIVIVLAFCNGAFNCRHFFTSQ